MLSLRRFFVYSIAFHITFFILALALLSPVRRDIKSGEFIAKIVSPEEFMTPTPALPEISKIRPILPSKSGNKNSRLNEKTETVSKPLEKVETQSSRGKGYESQVTKGTGDNIRGNKENNQKIDLPRTSLKERLFDSNIIGDIAKREIKKEESEATTFSFNARDLRYLPYLKRLKERIESIWIYPPDAASRGIYGDLIIRFTIKKNGGLGATELIRTSGHKSLDDAAIRALKEAEPFWPLPDEWGLDTYTIEGHFIYTIYGYYIR